MSPGKLMRILLGPLFPAVGRAYRRVFVDLGRVAAAFPTLPPGSTVLDVGGGDGAVINQILVRQPDLRVVMVDIAPTIGGMIDASRRSNVRMFAATSVTEFCTNHDVSVDVVLLSDVLHHVSPSQRPALLRDVMSAFRERPRCLVVKDIEPTGWRAALSLFCDCHISGDRETCLLDRDALIRLMREIDPSLTVLHTNLIEHDFPNYAIVFGDIPRLSTFKAVEPR
jgi:predicted nicotinamide N-methyase